MKVLIIGSGAREHALAWKIAQSDQVNQIFVAPGNAGCLLEPKTTVLEAITDNLGEIVNFAKSHAIDLAIVNSESLFFSGITDQLQTLGITCFGPTKEAAKIAGTKTWGQEFLNRHQIPIAKSEDKIGRRISFMLVTDGYHIIPLACSENRYRKEVLQEDSQGYYPEDYIQQDCLFQPSSSGMIAYSSSTMLPSDIEDKIMQTIIKPTIIGMAKEGRPILGFLTANILLTKNNPPALINFDCQLNDPEAQSILLRMKTDLIVLIEAALAGRLNDFFVHWDKRCSLALVLASEGYPESYETGKTIYGLKDNLNKSGVRAVVTEDVTNKIFYAAIRSANGVTITNGGRVLCVATLGNGAKEAQTTAYDVAESIYWEGMYYKQEGQEVEKRTLTAGSAR